MGPIRFCDRCKCMEVGWNRRFVAHTLVCHGTFTKSFKTFIYGATATLVIFFFPTATALVFSTPEPTGVESVLGPANNTSDRSLGALPMPISDPAVLAIESLLDRNSRLGAVQRARVAHAVVASSRRYDVDPYLVSSILLVESSGNPFAISDRDAVGIMQIHVPTWGSLVETEEINLFRVEDNVDLGARILKDYTSRFGLWDGVMRYLGAGGPTEEALDYVSRVQDIYSDRNAD